MDFLKKNALPLLILAALIIGVIAGKLIAAFPTHLSLLLSMSDWIGDAFLNLLQMIIAPLVFTSIVTGVAGIGTTSNLGRISAKTMSLFVATTLVAILVGLVLVNLIKPGEGVDILSAASASSDTLQNISSKQPSIGDILMGTIPKNIVNAFATNNILQIITFAIIFGIFTTKIEATKSALVLKFFDAVFNIMMQITSAIIKLTPIGIFGIVTVQIASHPDLGKLFAGLGLLILTVLMSIAIQMFIVIPIFLKTGKVKPFAHMRNMSVPLITAFTTASSSAALPLSIKANIENSGVSERIASFVLPLGATINMNGTALFECICVIFLAQSYGIDLSLTQQLIVIATSMLAAVGSAGIPMAGLVMMTLILSAVGLPLEGLGVIMSVNFIMDMARTSANVWGDCAVAAIVAKSEKEDLKV